jgi:hypothetical protein
MILALLCMSAIYLFSLYWLAAPAVAWGIGKTRLSTLRKRVALSLFSVAYALGWCLLMALNPVHFIHYFVAMFGVSMGTSGGVFRERANVDGNGEAKLIP